MNNLPSYFLVTACLFTFMVGPSSPPGRLRRRQSSQTGPESLKHDGRHLKSLGMTIHFWILWALLTASLLALSIPAWIPRITDTSGPSSTWPEMQLIIYKMHIKIVKSPLELWLHYSPGPEPNPWRRCSAFPLAPSSPCQPGYKYAKNKLNGSHFLLQFMDLIVIFTTSTARVRKQETNFCLSPSNNT